MMINPLIQMLMGQLQSKNPQMFQVINQARNNGANAQGILKQMISKASPQQIQSVMQRAEQMGVPTSVLNSIQNSK